MPALFDPQFTVTELRFHMLLKLRSDNFDLFTPEGRAAISGESDQAAVAILHTIGGFIVDNAHRLGGPVKQSDAAIVPWGFDQSKIRYRDAGRDGRIERSVDFGQPLAGQGAFDLNLEVGRVLYQLSEGSATAVLIVIDSIVYEDGSLFKTIRGHIATLSLAATLLGPVITEVGNTKIKSYNLKQEINAAIQHQGIVESGQFYYSDDELRDKGIRVFDYQERGLSVTERKHRIAWTQLALRLAEGTDLPIDGVAGPETAKHLKRFAEQNKVPASIRNPFLRAELLKRIYMNDRLL